MRTIPGQIVLFLKVVHMALCHSIHERTKMKQQPVNTDASETLLDFRRPV